LTDANIKALYLDQVSATSFSTNDADIPDKLAEPARL